MAPKYSRRAMIATAACAVLSPAVDHAFEATARHHAPPRSGHSHAMGKAHQIAGRRIRVTCGDDTVVVLHVDSVEEALAEAVQYRQRGDDLALWEGTRLIGTVAGYESGLPPSVIASGRLRIAGREQAVIFAPKGEPPADNPRCARNEDGPGWFCVVDCTPGDEAEANISIGSRPFSVGGYPLRVELRFLPEANPTECDDHILSVPAEGWPFEFAVFTAPSDERREALARWRGGDHGHDVIETLLTT